MSEFDGMRLAMSLRAQLLALTKLVGTVVAEAARPETTEKQRDDLTLQEKKLNFQIARLYPAYVAANEEGRLLLKLPAPELVSSISALSDQVQLYVKGQTATDRTLILVGQVLDLAAKLQAVK